MWNKMEIKYHLVTLFSMHYIHLVYIINHTFISSHIKDKTVTVSMRIVSIPSIDIKVWARKSELPPGNFLRYLTQP